MLITVRAYRHTDLDLMLLGDALGKNYSGFIRECLRCYLRGVPLRAGIPDIPFIPSERVTNQSKSTGVMLKDSDDADIIAMLKNIRYGYRNNFVKNVVRMYTMVHCIAAYADNETCYAMLRLPQEAKLNNTTILPVSEERPTRTTKSEFVPKPKYVATPKPLTEKKAEAPAAEQEAAPLMPTSTPLVKESPATAPTPALVPPAEPEYVPAADDSWGQEDVVAEEPAPETTSPSTGEGDDEMDILNMFAGMIG